MVGGAAETTVGSADVASVATVNPDTPNVLQTMMQLVKSKTPTKTVHRVDLEKSVEELKRQLQPKRALTDDDAGGVHDLIAEFDNCDLNDHHREGTRVQNRRHVEVGSHDLACPHRPGNQVLRRGQCPRR